MNEKPPITAASVPDEWISDVREILVRDGQAIRAGDGPSIEAKSLRTNKWGRLMLPGSGTTFTDVAERDVVLAKLDGRS